MGTVASIATHWLLVMSIGQGNVHALSDNIVFESMAECTQAYEDNHLRQFERMGLKFSCMTPENYNRLKATQELIREGVVQPVGYPTND